MSCWDEQNGFFSLIVWLDSFFSLLPVIIASSSPRGLQLLPLSSLDILSSPYFLSIYLLICSSHSSAVFLCDHYRSPCLLVLLNLELANCSPFLPGLMAAERGQEDLNKGPDPGISEFISNTIKNEISWGMFKRGWLRRAGLIYYWGLVCLP